MRSAFNKNDASANVRDINKAAIRKYMKDAPWGIGIGIFEKISLHGINIKIVIKFHPTLNTFLFGLEQVG